MSVGREEKAVDQERKILGSGTPTNSLKQKELISHWLLLVRMLSREVDDASYESNLEILKDITSGAFFGALILGKETDGYINYDEEKKKQLADAGIMFIHKILSDVSSETLSDVKPVEIGSNRLLDKARLALYQYMRTLPQVLTEPELNKIKEIRKDYLKLLEKKWEAAFKSLDNAYEYMKTAEKSENKPVGEQLLSNAENQINQVIFILNDDGPLPDFITRQDIIRLCIFAPSYIDNLTLTPGLLEKLGDISEFKEELEKAVTQAVTDGILPPGSFALPKFYNQLDAVKANKDKETIQAMLKKAGEDIAVGHLFLGRLERNVDYREQMRDLYDILKTGKLDKIEIENVDRFISDIENDRHSFLNDKDQAAQFSLFVKDNLEVKERYQSLKNLEEKIQDNVKKGGIWGKKEDLKKMHKEMQQRLKEMEAIQKRSDHLMERVIAHNAKKNRDGETEEKMEKAIRIKIRERKDFKKRKPAVKKNSKIGRILYFSIMTKRSIHAGKPTRKYLNQLYSDSVLNAFINSSWKKNKEFKDKITMLEKELVAEQVLVLAEHNEKGLEKIKSKAISHEDYIAQQRSIVQREILQCESKIAQAKTIEYWINVLEKAHENKDSLTVEMIHKALSEAPVDQLIAKGFVSTLISQEAKDKLAAITTALQAEQQEKIKQEQEAKRAEAKSAAAAAEEAKPEEQKLQEKREKAAREVSDVLDELYKIDNRFSSDMKKLEDFFQKVLPKDFLATLYCDDLHGCVVAPLVKPEELKAEFKGELKKEAKEEVKTEAKTEIKEEAKAEAKAEASALSHCVTNIEKIALALLEYNFSDAFKSNELASFNMEWMNSYIADSKLAQAKETKASYPSGLLSETIKPAQKNARYVLTLNEFIKKAKELHASYSDDSSLSEADRQQVEKLEEIIEVLEAQVSVLKQEMAEFNNQLDMLKLNRQIAYKLFKDSSKMPPAQRQSLETVLHDIVKTDPPPPIEEVERHLRHIKSRYGIETNGYVAEIYICKAERDLAEMHGGSEHLTKLNREIAIELLKASKNLDGKTKDDIMSFAIALCKEPPTDYEKILEFFDTIKLSKADTLKHHRLYRRMLKEKIADYLAAGAESIYKGVKSEEKITPEDRAEKVEEYLMILKRQWEVEETAHKFTPAEKQYNAHRIKAVSDALAVIDQFKGSTEIASIVYTKLIDQLELRPSSDLSLVEKTLESTNTIKELVNPLLLDLEHPKVRGVLPVFANVAYELFKKSNTISPSKRQGMRDLLNQIVEVNPSPSVAVVENVLKDIKLNYGINTNDYLAAIYICNAEQDLADMSHFADPNLVKLNREIAIELLKATKGIDPKTQDKIIEFAKKLCADPPQDCKKILEFLNTIKLTKADTVQGHRLHRRMLKEKIVSYLAVKAENVLEAVKNTPLMAPEDRAKAITEYLTILKEQWEAEGANHKLTPDEREHNAARIKLVSDALAVINQFNVSVEIMKIVVPELIAQLEHSDFPGVGTSFSIQTLLSVDPIANLTQPLVPIDRNKKAVDLQLSGDNNAFRAVCFLTIEAEQKAINEAIESNLRNVDNYSNELVASTLLDHLYSIQEAWAVEELEPRISNHGRLIEQRRTAVNEAISKLTGTPPQDSETVLKALERELEEIIKPSPVSSKIKNPFTRESKETKETKELFKLIKKDIEAIAAKREQYVVPLQATFNAREAHKQEEEKKRQADELAAQKAQKEKEKKEAKIAVKKAFVEGLAEDKNLATPKLKGFGSLLGMIKRATPEKFAREHLEPLSHKAPKPQNYWKYHFEDKAWQKINSEDITKKVAARDSNLRGPADPYVELAEGKRDTYENKGGTRIIVSHEEGHIVIEAKEPAAYFDPSLDTSQKLAMDLEIAEKMIRLWVATNGNSKEQPIIIPSSSNETRMRALIIVCRANNLEFLAPRFSQKFNYNFLLNPGELDAEVEALRNKMKADEREIKMLAFSPEKIQKIEQKVDALQDYVDAQLKQNPDEKESYEQYTKNIGLLRSLITDAKAGKINVTAFNEACKQLEADQHEIEAATKAPSLRP